MQVPYWPPYEPLIIILFIRINQNIQMYRGRAFMHIKHIPTYHGYRLKGAYILKYGLEFLLSYIVLETIKYKFLPLILR